MPDMDTLIKGAWKAGLRFCFSCIITPFFATGGKVNLLYNKTHVLDEET